MSGIKLIEHELAICNMETQQIEYISYIDDLSALFKHMGNKSYRLVEKGTRFDSYLDSLICKDSVSIYDEYTLLNYLNKLSSELEKEMYYEYGNRYAIIRYSTDNCYPNYRVEFTTKKRALSVDRSSRLSYADAEQVRNYHRDLVRVVRLRKGYKKPTQKWIDKEVARQAGWKYSPRPSQVLANHVISHSVDV